MRIFPDEKEARDIMEYDKQVEATKDKNASLEYDLSPEQQKIAQKFTKTGTRKVTLNLKPRNRKENATKAGIIAELAEFLEKNSEFATSDVQIVNKEREIQLKICGEWYSVTLKYNRNMNK